MARSIHKLAVLQVNKAARKGLTMADGGGLYLQRGSAWVFRYKRNGRTHYLGLGALASVDLPAARDAARHNRGLLHAGIDPLAERQTRRAVAADNARTFADCSEAYTAAHRGSWRNPKHRQQWQNTLTAYAAPIIGALPVRSIDTALVLQVLEPIWRDKPETASRLRGRIERIIGWAGVKGFRDNNIPNPARWRDNLDHLLPARATLREVEHHAALPYTELPSFMRELRAAEGIGARALEFAILTAVRTGDIIGADRDDAPPLLWPHVDFDKRLWTVPKTKNGSEHRVPLTNAALALLEQMKPLRDASNIVFPGDRAGRSLSNGTLLRVLHRMKRRDLTTHGFRACFKTWASKQTNFAHEIVESCLTHTISDKLERAYRRGDFLAKRTRLMTAWADYCHGRSGQQVVALRS